MRADGPRNGLRGGAGHQKATATAATAAARSQPAIRSGIAPSGAGVATGRTKASSRAVEAPASSELTTPTKSTAKPTTAIVTAARTGWRDTTVASATSRAPSTASQATPWTRSARDPLRSTSSSRANDPNAAKVATSASCTTRAPNAKSSGMTIATRAARRSARRPGSCRRSQDSGLTRSNLAGDPRPDQVCETGLFRTSSTQGP